MAYLKALCIPRKFHKIPFDELKAQTELIILGIINLHPFEKCIGTFEELQNLKHGAGKQP